MHGFANGPVNVVENAARERSNDAEVIGSPQKEANFCSFSGCSTQVTAEPGPVKQSACLVFDVNDEDVEVPVRFEKGKSFPPRCAFWLWMCGIFVMLCATLCDHVRADTDMGLRCALDGIFICIVVGYIYALTIQSSFFVLNSVRANYHSVRLAGMLPAQSSTMALHFTEKWPAGGVFVDRFVREYPLIFFAKCLLYASNEFFHYFLMRFEYWNTSEYFPRTASVAVFCQCLTHLGFMSVGLTVSIHPCVMRGGMWLWKNAFPMVNSRVCGFLCIDWFGYLS